MVCIIMCSVRVVIIMFRIALMCIIMFGVSLIRIHIMFIAINNNLVMFSVVPVMRVSICVLLPV